MRQTIILFTFLFVLPLFSQDFFDSVNEGGAASTPYELNGFMRGVFFGGRSINTDEPVLKSGYGELGLKMRARKGDWGDGYAELRFRRGYEFNESLSEMKIREAYVNMYLGNFDFRMGQQIVVWGRADGFNPTNNITPQNMLTRSADEDDRKMGNFLVRGNYNFHPFNLELIWVPQYRPSVLPTVLFQFPDFVTFGGEDNPNSELKNSSIAAKLDIGTNAIDGSVSYFRGYMPMPGIFPDSIWVDGNSFKATVVNRPYQMQVVGGDFSTTLGSFGFRGEIAWRQPIEDYQKEIHVHIPNPDVQYVLGMDKTLGDFSIIIQYVGRYVLDFTEFKNTGFPTDQLIINNRMIAAQLNEMSHAIFMRPAMAFLHETVDVEFLMYYDMTTEESLFRPVVSYDLTDALTFKLGAEMYAGPDNTLFGAIDKALSAGFVELRASF